MNKPEELPGENMPVVDPTFDMGALGAKVDEAAPFYIKDVRNGEKVKNAAGEYVFISMRSVASEQMIQWEREHARARRSRIIATGNEDKEAEDEREGLERLVHATVGWNITHMDGAPFPFSVENARKFWTDRRFSAYRGQATMFISSAVSFMKPLSGS